MLRRRAIFTKTLIVLLVIGLVPLTVMGVWTWSKAESRMTRAVVQYWLVRLARETADSLDSEVRQMRSLVRAWANDEGLSTFIDSMPNGGIEGQVRRSLEDNLRRHRDLRAQDLELLLYVRRDGTVLAACAGEDQAVEAALTGQKLADLPLSTAEQDWWRAAFEIPAPSGQGLEPNLVGLDWHRSKLLRAGKPEAADADPFPDDPSAYAIGFAVPIPTSDARPPGLALLAVFNWTTIQDTLDRVAQRFRVGAGPGEAVRYDQGYPFLFLDDCTTIIGHERRHLYGLDMARDIGLTGFRDAMLERPYGHYQYEYPENSAKISSFAHCQQAPTGFGWAVGIGLYHSEVYSDVRELRNFWVWMGVIVFFIVIGLSWTFSAGLTRPIQRLADSVTKLGRGEQIEPLAVHTNDEIQDLAEAFERMRIELEDKERRLVRAEKEAAWRTMAQQAAHEIKNPLTPILLSAQQIRRSFQDQHPKLERIVEDSTEAIVEQCEMLRNIASDFASLASARHERKRIDLVPLLRRVVANYSHSENPPIAVGLRIETADRVVVSADETELRRVLLNLFNNAVQAFGERGGHIAVTLQGLAGPRDCVAIHIADDGPGVAPEHADRLFEPSFSTRTGGTGLGLAICRAIMERHDGSISYEAGAGGKGAVFILALPLDPSGATDDKD